MKENKNRGAFYDRTKCNIREAAFAKAWENENKISPSLNHGFGLLQDLFCHADKRFGYAVPGVADHIVTEKEREIAATVIQWLGSNCGWCFLGEVLSECGYTLTKKK